MNIRKRIIAGSAAVGILSAATFATTAAAAPETSTDHSAAVQSQASATGNTLVGIDQNKTGPQSAYNCGPTSAVIALKSIGKTPKGWLSKSTAVQQVRKDLGTYGPTDLGKYGKIFKAYKVKTSLKTFQTALNDAKKGKTVILNINTPAGGHYIVAKGVNSQGKIYTSNPNGGNKGAKTTAYLNSIARHDRGLTVG